MTQIIDYSDKAIAVIGDTKSIKDSLKELGGRFNFRLSCGAGWIFPKTKLGDVQKLLNVDCMLVNQVNNNEDRFQEATQDELKAEFAKVWKKDTKMIDYSLKSHSVGIKLSNGKFITFDKPYIDTEFWIGESDCGQGLSHDEAQNVVSNIKSNFEKYFLDKNMSSINNLLKKANDETYNFYTVRQYDEIDNNFVCFYLLNSECGYEYNRLRKFGKDFQKVTNEDDIALIKWAIQLQATRFEKRLHTYLKRYGTSKLRCSTYWVDR
jgi:hypothetical protein